MNTITISADMKALVKSSPVALLLLSNSAEQGQVMTSADDLRTLMAAAAIRVESLKAEPNPSREVQQILLFLSDAINYPFEADTVHGMLEEFEARVAPHTLLVDEPDAPLKFTDHIAKAKENFANV